MKERASRKTSRVRLDEMINQLRNDIVNGNYQSGTYLPSESSLAELYRLSNNTVRKGLEGLVAEGLIVKENRIGNRVTEFAQSAHTTITLGILSTLENDIELTKLLMEFQKKYPSVRVKTLLISKLEGDRQYPYLDIIDEYTEQGIIDTFVMNHTYLQEFLESSSMHLLEELSVHPETYPFLREAFKYKESYYVQPLVFSPVVLCYNKDHFSQAGLFEPDSSWTWDDCIHYARALSQPNDIYGFYFYVLSENRWPNFLLQSGMKFEWNADGVCDIRNSPLLESIKLYKKLIHTADFFPKYYTESSGEVNQLFLEGKVSMILTPYMSMNDFKHSKLNYDISPLPYFREPLSLMITYGLAISKKSKQKEAAKLLVHYLASKEAQMLIRQRTLTIPANKLAAESPVSHTDSLNRPSRYSMFRELISSFRLHQELNLSTTSFKILRNLLKMYMSGIIDEDVLCEKIRLLPPPGERQQ